MRPVLLAARALAMVLATTASTAADPHRASDWGEIAMRHCAPEWAALVALEPAPFEQHDVAQISPALGAAQAAAYDRFGTATHALAGYVAVFMGLGAAENQNHAYMKRVRARFDLAMCLSPDPAERALVKEVARAASDMGEAGLRAALFRGFDQFDCMKMDEASQAVFEAAAQPEPYPFDFAAIVTEHLQACG
ncbi:hypothetical protein KUV47_01345 [Vannielia litorea]|uniref:hypothetical protein n=1 Tax=Vannielia litorea TaxID=1217970 RepID=UPI001C972CDB|nr:hypothetical protein [Vannielia litorea]MBY6151842.1 hypothetical protein [Vannielia litorea]